MYLRFEKTLEAKMLLGVNIDHVATLRNARGENHPDLLRAALVAESSGADIITMHLREDRRHIKDADVFLVKEVLNVPINFEIASTDEMVSIALKLLPRFCCVVPENRAELTTEGGLNLSKENNLRSAIQTLKDAGIEVNLFVEPEIHNIIQAKELGADGVEIHTGRYANLFTSADKCKIELNRIIAASAFCQDLDLKCNIGHGLNLDNLHPLLAIPHLSEVHIGHYIIGEALFQGLGNVVNRFKAALAS
jgi:pyridoxine 5-phosphate synthase